MARNQILPDFKRPLVFAHRGISAVAPENTMASFKLAREKGMPGIELDIHLTADGYVPVFHDHDTGRVGGAPGMAPGLEAKGRGLSLEKSNWADLHAVDIGSWKGSQYKSERMILLSELFEEFGTDFYYDIELKSTASADYGLEAAAVKIIRAAKNSGELAKHLLVSSFNPVSLARFKTLMPGIPTAIIWCNDKGLPWFLRGGEGRWIGHVDYLKPEHVKVNNASSFRWRKLEGYEVVPWTIDDPELARNMLEKGCSGVISNRAHELGLVK